MPQVIGLGSHMYKVILEAVIPGIKFKDFVFQELDFFQEFLLLMLEVLLMGVVVDIFGEEFLDVFLFLKNDFVFFVQDLSEVLFVVMDLLES